ncbi:MAG: LPS export ABC transporter periplasmic protein LptC [Ignavibacteriae bacterium]|nr:LPS export ABC transporter periplasmic protein LptC [Ignavibacteriota bacterium]
MKNISVIFLLFVIFSACESKVEPPRTDLKSGEIPDQESWKSSVAFSDSGNVKAILNAGHISVYNSKAYTLIDSGAVVDFYKAGEKVSTLTGKRGKVLDATKDIEMYDSVVVVNKEGSVLRTSKLYWNNKLQKVSSDVYVKITTPKEDIEGIGFESDQNLKNYTIYKVTGVFTK